MAEELPFEAFVAYVAHELKTPIVGIKGFADLLADRHAAALGEDGASFVEKIRASAVLLEEMVDGLRDLMATAGPAGAGESLDPLDLLHVVREILAPEALASGVGVFLPDAAPRVTCGRAPLFQMLKNLVLNAVRHSDSAKAERWVRVAAAEAGPEVVLRVEDNGVGLDPEELREVFVPFRRGRRARGTPGVGLGLAISLRIAERWGGRIEVASEPGAGSSFSLVLPRAGQPER